MKRKIVQICMRSMSAEDEAAVLALADDGTLWEGYNTLCNQQEIEEAYKIREEQKKGGLKVEQPYPIPPCKYSFQWHQMEGLPDNTSNLSKVR